MSQALSLTEELASVADPRSPKGRRHPLIAILSLTVVATLAGMKSLEAIAQFGRDHGLAFAHALGFTRGKTPNRYFSPEDWRDGSAVGIKRIVTTSCYQLRRPPRHDTL